MLIALIEPSKSFRAVIKSVLAESSVQWSEFAAVAELRDWWPGHRADMVITAKELPDGTYLDVLQVVRVQAEGEYLPVYLFSSDESERLVSEAFAHGVTDVFEKQRIGDIVHLLRKLAFFSEFTQGARVLLVEDDPAISLYYAQQLGQAGLDVLTATGSQEALAILDKEPVDLVITDL
ncbi:MAG: response regulator, partial [Oceanisphaera sp.]|nr:response regulator [Oceanisphaera sp.]